MNDILASLGVGILAMIVTFVIIILAGIGDGNTGAGIFAIVVAMPAIGVISSIAYYFLGAK